MQLYIVTYTHRHGLDVWPRFTSGSRPPSRKREISMLCNWEDEEGGDFLEISGPFPVPSQPKKAGRKS